MTFYRCFFSRFVGDVSEFVVIEAETDAQAMVKAAEALHGSDNYSAVEVCVDDRMLGRIERTVPAGPVVR